MHLLNERNLADYLRNTGRLDTNESLSVRELSGGVSNVVFYVSGGSGGDFVVKQARERLRVEQEWLCRVDRIWREVDVLRICRKLLDQAVGKSKIARSDPPDASQESIATVPAILWEDRENYCFAMTAAPEKHVTWKQQLLQGVFDVGIAAACGRLLGTLHAGSWKCEKIAAQLADRSLFDDLRLDPYYRTLARLHPEFAPPMHELIDSVPQNLLSLVHADFSPKNLLVSPGALMMVDFETGHYGDPAFDLGFFLSHLFLKFQRHAAIDTRRGLRLWGLIDQFWQSYWPEVSVHATSGDLAALERRSILHLAACGWARLDGKSPVEYLTNEAVRTQVRIICQRTLRAVPANWGEFYQLVRETI